jgi:hypothetical protein
MNYWIRDCERSAAIQVFSWCAAMDRHGLLPRDDDA